MPTKKSMNRPRPEVHRIDFPAHGVRFGSLTSRTLAVDYDHSRRPLEFLVSHHHEHPEPPSRRTVLHWALYGVGAIFGAILGVPVVSYLIDPRNRPKPSGDFRVATGVKISDVDKDRPVQGTIRDVRWDSFTLYPDDVIGRVWVNRTTPKQAGNGPENFEVFATKCPHLGCSINCNPDQALDPGFTCPCHNGRFNLNGSRIEPGNPAPRGMYALEFKIEDDTLFVKYVIPANDAADGKKA